MLTVAGVTGVEVNLGYMTDEQRKALQVQLRGPGKPEKEIPFNNPNSLTRILAVASGPTFLSPLLERSWMVLLGEASYSLYIIHWSVFTFLHMGYLGRYSTPAVHAVFLLATVGASLLCYRYVEVPWRDRLRGSREPVVAVGTVTA